MHRENERGHARVTAVLLLIGLVVAGVWVWKRLSFDTQDLIVEQVVPMTALALAALWGLWLLLRPLYRRRRRVQAREALLATFVKTQAWEQRRALAFELIEINEYRLEGLEKVVGPLREIFTRTLKQAIGDKQHRIRGMAASHLGVLRDPSTVPLLVAALEDDHAYVRSCAALGLGRMRAVETKEKLAEVAKEDWDQTVRSRAREAVERMK